MSGTDWDAFDGDDADDYPGAPVPPHERQWRHPSELSPVAVPPPRPFGRATLVGTGVVGLALLAGLTQLVMPRSGGSGVATDGTQAIGSSTLQRQPAATVPGRLLQTTDAAPRTSAAPATAAATVSSVLATAPVDAVSTVVLLASKQAAVPIGDGHRALTTAGSLSKDDTLAVQLGNGTEVYAVVIRVDLAANVAVLQLDEAAGGGAPVLNVERAHHGDLVYVGCTSPEDGVLESTANGMVVKMTNTAEEGAPVMDQAGALIGLASTDSDGTVRLVPISDAISMAYTEDEVQPLKVWLGVGFSGEALVVDSIQPQSPAESAGLLPGDLVLAIGDIEVIDVDELWNALMAYAPGDATTLLVERDGEPLELPVTVAARPS